MQQELPPPDFYLPEELDGLPVERFIEAVSAEGLRIGHGLSDPFHLHPVFTDVDIYGDGKPTQYAFTPEDVRAPGGSLPVPNPHAGEHSPSPGSSTIAPPRSSGMRTPFARLRCRRTGSYEPSSHPRSACGCTRGRRCG